MRELWLKNSAALVRNVILLNAEGKKESWVNSYTKMKGNGQLEGMLVP